MQYLLSDCESFKHKILRVSDIVTWDSKENKTYILIKIFLFFILKFTQYFNEYFFFLNKFSYQELKLIINFSCYKIRLSALKRDPAVIWLIICGIASRYFSSRRAYLNYHIMHILQMVKPSSRSIIQLGKSTVGNNTKEKKKRKYALFCIRIKIMMHWQWKRD